MAAVETHAATTTLDKLSPLRFSCDPHAPPVLLGAWRRGSFVSVLEPKVSIEIHDSVSSNFSNKRTH